MQASFRNKIVKLLALKYVRRGFSHIAAEDMVSQSISQRTKGNYSKIVRKTARRYGFLPSTVLALGINEDNYMNYLSDKDYYSLTPFNGEYHFWVNNKITLKYLLGDMASYMPKYFFQVQKDGTTLKLFECPRDIEATPHGILKLLYQERSLAIKRIEGFGGTGFYKAYLDEENKIYVNDKIYSEIDFITFVSDIPNYLIMEYLESAGLPASIYPKTSNSIRLIYGKHEGRLYNIGNFIKFGNAGSGYVDNLCGGGISCPVDEQGKFSFGYTIENGVMVQINEHPDTRVALSGKLECWDEIEQIAMKVMERLPQLSYCGFDFVISDKGIKILEINDMSGLKTIQKYTPLLQNKEDNFYLKRIEKKYGRKQSRRKGN